MFWESVCEGIQRKKESRVVLQDLLSHLGIGTESKERPQKVICHGDGDKVGFA